MNKLRMSQIAGMNLQYALYPLNYFLDSMVKYEVENVELWGGSPHLYSEDIALSEVSAIRREIERRGLTLVCYTPDALVSPFNIAAEESNIRKRSVDYCLKNIEIAAELGTKLMLVTSGWGYYTEPLQAAWERSRDSLAILTDKAEELNIVLTLEPLQPFESNLVTNVKAVKRMIEEIRSPYMKGNFDTCAMAVAGDSIHDYFRELGANLNHIHFNDGTPFGHLAWGDGTLPMEQYLGEIASYDYQGYLTLEIAGSLLPVNPQYFVEPEKAFKQSIDQLKSVLNS